MEYNFFDGVMFNAYPDSCGGNFTQMVGLLDKEEFKELFSMFYILPSMFKSDLDRGFSVKSYELDDKMISSLDLKHIQDMNINLKLDFVLNHLSVLSPQFQDILKNGDKSKYVDMFIDWNNFFLHSINVNLR